MNINRINYEEFFLLYADNELSENEKQLVEAFVAQHKDLKPELDMILQAIVPDEQNVSFPDKESLFRTTDINSLVNLTNYESYFVRYADDELNNEEKAATEQFVYKNPECQADFELILQVKLSPDTSIQFPDKVSLYRRSDEKKKPVIVLWIRYAAAAIVLLLAGLFWLQQSNNVDKPGNTVAEINNKPEQPAVEKPLESSNTHKIPEEVPVLAKKEIVDKPVQLKIESPGNLRVRQKEKKRADDQLIAQKKTDVKAADALTVIEKLATVPEIEVTALAKQPNIAITKPVIVDTDKAPTVEYINAAKEDYIYVSSSNVVRKTPLRGLLRKASRFVEQNNPLNSDHKKSGVFTASNDQQ